MPEKNQNIATLPSVSIHSYSSEFGPGYADKIIDGKTTVYNNYISGTGTGQNEWIIIDLGQTYTITGFSVCSTSVLDTTRSVKNYRIGMSNSGVGEEDFVVKISGQALQPKHFGGIVIPLWNITAVSPTSTRYVKLYLDDNYGNSEYIASAEIQIFASELQAEQKDIVSNTEIYLPTGNSEVIYSNAQIFDQIISEQAYISSLAEIDPNRAAINSDALIANAILSDTEIIGHITSDIVSDARILQSGSFSALGRNVFIMGRAYVVSPSSTRSLFTHTYYISNSSEVVVPDMITSMPFDMQTISPPLGYQNYDWAYDWVIRTYNQAKCKVEARSAETLLGLQVEVFSEIKQGQCILRGNIPRFHQLRCHVWASGSRDFELHQLSIKGYVQHCANPLYRTLYSPPFTTVSNVHTETYRPYEPLDELLWKGKYVPGDVNGNGYVNDTDAAYLYDYLYSSASAPSPLWVADVNGSGEVDFNDYTYLVVYLQGLGTPPIYYY